MRDPDTSAQTQIAAIALLLDRGYGRATQPMDVTLQRNYDELSDAELTAIIRSEEQAVQTKTGAKTNGNGTHRPY